MGEPVYRCFLPDLTGFAGSHCVGPGHRRRASADCPAGRPLGRGFSPAVADCGYRAPLAPRLARPSGSLPSESAANQTWRARPGRVAVWLVVVAVAAASEVAAVRPRPRSPPPPQRRALRLAASAFRSGHGPGGLDRGGDRGRVRHVQRVTAVADDDQSRLAQPAVEGLRLRRRARCDRAAPTSTTAGTSSAPYERASTRRSADARSRSSTAWRNGSGRSATASAARAYAAGQGLGPAGQSQQLVADGVGGGDEQCRAGEASEQGSAQDAGQSRRRQPVRQHVAADGHDRGHVGGEELGAGHGDRGAERVADEHRPLETEPADRLVEQVRLADRRVTVTRSAPRCSRCRGGRRRSRGSATPGRR